MAVSPPRPASAGDSVETPGRALPLHPHRVRDLRLLAPAVVAWVAAGIAIGVPPHLVGAAAAVAGAAAVVALLAAVWTPRSLLKTRRHTSGDATERIWAGGQRRAAPTGAAVVLAVACAVLTSTAVSADPRRPEQLVEWAEGSRQVEVTGVLTRALTHVDVASEDVVRVLMRAESASAGPTTHAVDVPIAVLGVNAERAAEIGSQVTVAGQLVATDRGDQSAFLLFANGMLTVEAGPSGPVAVAGQLRERFREVAAALPGDGAALLPGLAIGDTSAVGDELDSAMKASSLTHLTAVSGANCAVMVGIAIAVGAAIRLGRPARIVLATVTLVGFVVLVTPEPSVLRASVMALCVLVASQLGRPAAGVAALSVAIVVLLVIDPWLSRGFGFVLSVLATGGLLLLAGPLTRRLEGLMPRPLAAAIAVPLAAQLACQPAIILLTPSIPVLGVVANLLAAPAAPLATVIGVAVCLIASVFPPLAVVLAWIAWVPAAWIGGVAHFFAAAPGAQMPWLPGGLGALMAAGLTLVGLVIALSRHRPTVRAAGAVMVLLFVVTAGIRVGGHIGTVSSRPSDWQLAVCDVGQGDAMLVRNRGQTALIDTGPDAALLERCLGDLGVHRIDLLVITHFDLDHVGALPVVAPLVDVAVAPPGDPRGEHDLALLRQAGVTVVSASAGTHGMLGDLRWTAVWPPRRGAEPGNDGSLVTLWEGTSDCDCLSLLLLGDLGATAQARLGAALRPLLPSAGVDVVSVAHHGSADQHPPLYGAVGAKLGVIGVGAENTYGHPAQSILGALEAHGTRVARTDLHGMILVSRREDVVGVWTERTG